MLFLRSLLSTFLFLGFSLPAMASDLTGVASVIDGDTLEIHGQRIRLSGIDAPESNQTCITDGRRWRCGQRASLALSDHIQRRVVRCENLGQDRYKRVLGRCWLGAQDLNRWMVEQGWAVPYLRYSKAYQSQGQAAQAARRGLWASEFDMPWDWRRASRRR